MPDSFSMLDKRIQSVLQELKFKETPIHEKQIPQIISGRNVLLIAPTGIGKTEAALMPVLHNFLQKPSKGIGAETAVRLLVRMRKTEKELFKNTLEAQKTFLKTKKYWK